MKVNGGNWASSLTPDGQGEGLTELETERRKTLGTSPQFGQEHPDPPADSVAVCHKCPQMWVHRPSQAGAVLGLAAHLTRQIQPEVNVRASISETRTGLGESPLLTQAAAALTHGRCPLSFSSSCWGGHFCPPFPRALNSPKEGHLAPHGARAVGAGPAFHRMCTPMEPAQGAHRLD